MTVDAILDRLLIPRPNGSEGLARTRDFLAHALERAGATVSYQDFWATPHGFELTWTVVLILVAAYVVAIARRRYGLALLLPVLTAGLLMAEFEYLRSPVSGLLPASETNVIGTFPGEPGGPTIVFSAHYDTTTHLGDHLDWGRWGFRQGPATALALLLAAAGLLLRRRGRELPRALSVPLAVVSTLPFAAMFVFQAVGPHVRTPSPGAIDNGGSVAALLRLAERLGARPPGAPTTVRLVLLAAEEERALGSWAYARSLRDAGEDDVLVVNLESIGASDDLGYVPEDGFGLRRYRSPEALVRLVSSVAERVRGRPLPARPLPFGTLTDGRSFLAQGLPAVTLRAFTEGAFPRRLHSAHDSRDRLSPDAIERTADLLLALVERLDRDPAAARIAAGGADARGILTPSPRPAG